MPRRASLVLSLCLLGVGARPAVAAPIDVAVVAARDAGELERRVLLDARLRPVPPEAAQVLWVVGAPPGDGWSRLLERVRAGAGLVLVVDEPHPDLGSLGLRVEGWSRSRASLVVGVPRRVPRELVEDVVWPTAPQVGKRLLLTPTSSMLEPVILDGETRRPLLLVGSFGRGRVAVLAVSLLDPSNRELALWPYHNYLLHVLSRHAAGAAADRYADWPASPLPGSRTLLVLLVVLGLAWALTVALFLKARRYSRQHPEELTRFFAEAPTPSTVAKATRAPTWSAIGFGRSLAGFLTLAGTLFVLFAPYYYVTNILIPNDVQPFPQAKGIWEFAWEALQIAWFLFDAGTFVAFVKYFAEFRIKEPAEALRSAQFFVWWQILTGLVQVTLAGIVAVVFLPHTRYGYSSTFVILIAVSQYPGCFGVVTFFFQAYQRFDYNIALDLLSDWVLRFALMIPCVLLFRAWGVANPEYGEAFGAAIGIGVGYYLSTILTFVIGLLLYRRLGLRLLPLFLAHFDLKTALRMLRFGVKVVLGQAFFRAAKTIDRVVISLLLVNYTEWLGIEGQIHFNLMFLFPVAYRFFETSMAALSESHGNGKRTLTQYYLARFFQVGSLYTAIGLSLMWALGPLFVERAMDPQWARAADYVVIAAVIGMFYAPAWLSDMLQKGAGRPGLFAVILGGEQAVRIGLFWVLIPRYQFWGFYLSLLLTIALKVTVAWVVNSLVIVRLRIYFWQMLVAPALAGLCNFALLRLVGAHLALSGRLETIAVFFGAALCSFFVCFFAHGLFGGADPAFADELEQASRMTGLLRPLTRLFYLAARAGWTFSPLHGRFPITIHAEAMAQARELEALRDAEDREQAEARAQTGGGGAPAGPRRPSDAEST